MEREDAAEAAAAAARILSEVEEDVDREATVTMGTLGVVNYYIKDVSVLIGSTYGPTSFYRVIRNVRHVCIIQRSWDQIC